MVQDNFLPGDLADSDSVFLDKIKIRHFVELQKTPEGRKKFFESRMEVFDIPDWDPKINLLDKRGVRVKNFIKKGSFLGVVPGVLRHTKYEEATYLDLLKEKEKLEKGISAKAASPKDLILYYEDELEKNQSQGVLYQNVVHWRAHRFTLAIHQGKLGPMNLINSVEKDSPSNGNVGVSWIKFADNLCPILVAISTADIKPGEELLQTYLKELSYLEALDTFEGKSPEKRKANDGLAHDSIINIYTKINETAKDLGIDKQIQILPTETDREVIDALGLFRR